ncbi:MAG: hypothetical protein WEA29_00025 [Acidimicrobiia bacterium]
MELSILAGQQDGGFTLPSDPGAAAVWGITLAVIVGLYLLVKRTRRRADEAFRERIARRDSPRDRTEDPRDEG